LLTVPFPNSPVIAKLIDNLWRSLRLLLPGEAQPPLAQADPAPLPDHQMIQQIHPQEYACFDRRPRAKRSSVRRWVVVDHDDRDGIALKS
jgi:hypothetical protein